MTWRSPKSPTERKEKALKYTVEKTIFIAETKKCLEEDMKARFQYGIGIKSSIVNFLMIQMMSLQRVREHFKGLTGKFISESTMLKHVVSLGRILKKGDFKSLNTVHFSGGRSLLSN